MPSYSYRCNACGHEFTEVQKISDDALTDCPNCGKADTLQRLIGKGVGIQFVGSGFYVNDSNGGPGDSSGS